MFFLPAIVTQAVGSEDDRAFIHRLYQNYANFLFFQARKYAVPMMNAEDIVQETMLRVIENLEKYRSFLVTSGQPYSFLLSEVLPLMLCGNQDMKY